MSRFMERYKTDRNLEENGQWVELGDGLEIKVARISSERSKAVRHRLEKPYAKMRGEIPTSIQEQILIKQIAEAVLLDWKGVTDDEGKAIECTVDAKVKMLTEFKDFLQDVVMVAMEAETFKAQKIEEASKN